jgi:hypothetical protein
MVRKWSTVPISLSYTTPVEQDAQAAALAVQTVAEQAIADNAVKPGQKKFAFPAGGTVKVRKPK